MPNIEIVSYSGTGNTSALAKLIAQTAQARVWELPQDGEAKPEM